MVGRTCEKDAWKSDGVMVGESSESWSDKRRKRRVNGKNTGTKLRKTAQKLEVTGKPVGKCLHPGTHALPRTHGRTTRKHNTSGPIYGTDGSRKISFHKKSLWRDRCESPNSSRPLESVSSRAANSPNCTVSGLRCRTQCRNAAEKPKPPHIISYQKFIVRTLPRGPRP